VGVVALPSGRQITIDSKVGRSNLLYLLRYANDHPSTTVTERTDLTEGETFLDLLAIVYLDELDYVLQQGLIPTYQGTERTESHLRGTLNVQRQVQRQGLTPTGFECDFEDHTYDTPLNRTVLYAAFVLGQLVTTQSIEGQLQARITRLRDRVTLEPVSRATVDQLAVTRLTDHYSDLLRLAGLVIEGTFIDAFDPGSQQGVTTLLDMNRIYEQVIERCARTVVQDRTDWTVRTQATTRSLVTGSPSVDLRPDFMIEVGGDTELVGDAKWKTRRQNSDIYQMVSYELAEDAPGILVYPGQGEELTTEYQIRSGQDLRLIELPVDRYVSDFEAFCETIESAFEDEVHALTGI
jgi:5-methylcytosine-specific restriction enzyme subunit McrC